MDSPNALEMLLGAGGNTQQAFVSILLETLKRLEGKVDALDRKLDDRGAEINILAGRVATLERRLSDRAEGVKTWLPVTVTGLIGLSGLVVALLNTVFKH